MQSHNFDGARKHCSPNPKLVEPTAEQKYQEAYEADLARQKQWRQQEQQYQYALEEDRARQRLWTEADLANQQRQPQAKMGWGIFIVALVLSLIADVAEMLTAGTLGWFVGLVIDLILLLVLGFSTAGRKQFKKWIWGPVIEKIPILAAIPFIRVGFLIWAFVSSRPNLISKVQKGLSIASKLPLPISAELKAASKVANIGAGVQQAQTSRASVVK